MRRSARIPARDLSVFHAGEAWVGAGSLTWAMGAQEIDYRRLRIGGGRERLEDLGELGGDGQSLVDVALGVEGERT